MTDRNLPADFRDLVATPEWHYDAACRGLDPALFFIERGKPTGPPKRVCRGCVVRKECLEYALTNREKFGIWGGKSERERRLMRRARGRAS